MSFDYCLSPLHLSKPHTESLLLLLAFTCEPVFILHKTVSNLVTLENIQQSQRFPLWLTISDSQGLLESIWLSGLMIMQLFPS